MPIIVQKYGGSSVADAAKIREVARKVVACKTDGHDVVVVVSAMGKTTNELIALAKELSPAPSRRELDMLLTAGERITAALLSIAITEMGHEAVSLTGSQCGILTNDRHTDARIIEVRPVRVEDELARGRIVIVAGFQGVSYKREITTLGRGGSDTTAVALAAALGAEGCEIYSDVDGVYSADPRQVSAPRHLPAISYEEMQEMSLAGAKVLHAAAVEFAKRAGIAIYARAAFAPGRETVIRRDTPTEEHGVRSVVSEREVAWVRLAGAAALDRVLEILDAVEASEMPIKELRCQRGAGTGDAAVGSFVVTTSALPDWARARAALLTAGRGEIEVVDGLSAVSLIGIGVNRDTRNVQRALRVLQQIGAPLHALSTSGFRISLITSQEHLLASVQELHRVFVENQPAAPSLAEI
jgi:aspartate kinase